MQLTHLVKLGYSGLDKAASKNALYSLVELGYSGLD